MKELSRKTVKRSTNCGGPDQVFVEVHCEVEESDVGRTYEHYLGFNHRGYRITADDVGRIAVRSMQVGYICWWFKAKDV